MKQHDASGGQAPTIDPPALEHAGVEHVRIGALARGGGRSQPLAPKDPKRERGRARGLLLPPHDVAADDAPPDMHVEGGVDRNRCGARNVLRHLGVGERAAGAVAQEQADEDDRVLGQSRGLLQHLLECAIGQLDRLEAVPIARGHLLELDRRGRRRTPPETNAMRRVSGWSRRMSSTLARQSRSSHMPVTSGGSGRSASAASRAATNTRGTPGKMVARWSRANRRAGGPTGMTRARLRLAYFARRRSSVARSTSLSGNHERSSASV